MKRARISDDFSRKHSVIVEKLENTV
jgi:hypothetical protein